MVRNTHTGGNVSQVSYEQEVSGFETPEAGGFGPSLAWGKEGSAIQPGVEIDAQYHGFKMKDINGKSKRINLFSNVRYLPDGVDFEDINGYGTGEPVFGDAELDDDGNPVLVESVTAAFLDSRLDGAWARYNKQGPVPVRIRYKGKVEKTKQGQPGHSFDVRNLPPPKA
jgi:hypothetical protein